MIDLAYLLVGLEKRLDRIAQLVAYLDREGVKLVMPRYAMSFMKGPMTRGEIRRAVWEGVRKAAARE